MIDELFDSQQEQEMVVFSESIETGSEAVPISYPTGFLQTVSPRGSKVACDMKLTAHLCLMPRLRMSGAMSSPLVPLWHAQGPLYFYFSKTCSPVFMLSMAKCPCKICSEFIIWPGYSVTLNTYMFCY